MLHIIANPSSSSGNGKTIIESVKKILNEKNIDYKLYETTGPESARNFASEITCDNERDIIIGIGGDGTMNEIFSGIRDLSKVTVGYIPSGSGGDLARDLNIPLDPFKALENILSPKQFLMMDIGQMENAECTKRFAVSSGIGFDAAVCHEALTSKLKPLLNKFHLGKLTYVLIALKQLATTQKTKCTIILDGARKIEFNNLYLVATMIHRYEGGGFMFCPKAKCDDGIMDICVASDISKLKVLSILPTAYEGKHVNKKGISIYTAKKIEIIADRPLCIHADGEYAGVQSKNTITLCDQKVRMIVR